MRLARKEWHLGEIELGMSGFVEVEDEVAGADETAAAEVEEFEEPDADTEMLEGAEADWADAS